MNEAIKTLIHYQQYYHECFVKIKLCGKPGEIERRNDDVKTIVMQLDLDRTKTLHVMSVGCGNGTKDEPVIDNLLTNYPNITYTAVEPVADELTKFKQLVIYKKDTWRNVTFDFHAATIEEFLQNEQATQFGMIFAAQSAYHFKDVERTILDLYNCLVTGGILFTRMDCGGWAKLSEKVDEYYTIPDHNSIGADTIEDIFNRIIPNVRYQTKEREFWIDVTECFDEESQLGSCIIDFCTQIYKFQENCKPEIKKQILDYMRDECCKKENNRLLLTSNERDIFIFRE